MPSCAFDKCRNHSRKENKSQGITFHAVKFPRFPQDELWRHKWVRVVRRQRREPEWAPTSHSRVCSLHFKCEDMYTTGKGRKRISHGAVPSFKDPIAIKPPKPVSPHSSASSNSDSSDSDTIEETTINKFLKRKIEKVVNEKRRLQQVNSNLKKQIKRLKIKCKNQTQKCKTYKEIVISMKEKISLLETKISKGNLVGI